MRLNQEIDNLRVRLIDMNGTNLGVVPIEEAQRMAEQAELDLVEIVPNADPPVCRVMNYGKYKFEQSKKAQQSRKKQKQIQVKEVKFRPGTEEGDYRVKIRNITRFLSEGDKAKVTIRFRGREMMHQELGAQLLQRVESDLEGIGAVEQRPKLEGRQMVMVFSPRKSK
ncbi:MAG TPA: translation initiation factor IF-3 [Gammaproteobacteria bacterium]|nr:translation initiation factor IF-3 [Gammaproteobacteria bacterium]